MREKSKGRQKSSVAQPPQICDFTQQMRPQSIVDKKLNALIAFILFAFSLTIYWLTQNRSVTFWDVGEY
ncbi:MAG: hypothetical protein WCX83_05275, partial [Candidatus Cloacimonas sp.]|nr:hypothetical protein [Candidatus Cloacimonadota bacterium]